MPQRALGFFGTSALLFHCWVSTGLSDPYKIVAGRGITNLLLDRGLSSVALASDVEDNHIDRPWLSHRVNLPNYITLTRIAAIPLLIWILCTPRFSSEQTGEREVLASAVFILASITDGIDGYLARKRGQITTMGMLLDPLADKLLIAAAFITLVQFNPALVPAWMAVVIIGREFLVSGLRSIAASEGFTIQASELGKFKMLVQIISVVAVILARRWHEWPVFGIYIFPVYWIARLAIWFMVLLSLVSALDYFIAFWARIDHKSEKRRRRAFVLARRRKRDVQAV